MNQTICPVPLKQRPLNEFNSIKNSWIISWPLLTKSIYHRKLLHSWVFITPITLLISYGSNYLKNNIFHLILISLTASLMLPVLLLSRQWLSWIYIYKRLNSENIEYEESGWYDGQVWEKPIDWRAKELLIAQYQVKPILSRIKMTLLTLLASVLASFIYILIEIN